MDKKIRILKNNKEEIESEVKDTIIQKDENPEDDDKKEARRARRQILRAALVVFGLIFTICLSIAVGGGLALWDMGKTPKDLFIANKGNYTAAKESELTFIDADSAGDAEDVLNEEEDTALTFIDADEISEEEPEPETILDEEADAVTFTEDGRIIVSSEIAGVHSIKKAGSDEILTVAKATTANMANPNEGFPRPFTAVDESYFNDALFIGDSRFYGFMLWSGIPGANYCATSFNIFQYETFKVVQTGNGKVPIFNALPYNAFTKIYIKVGLNEMGSSEQRFEEKYAEIIARLREMEPRAIIYIHAVLPVTANKSATDRTHNNPNIIARNASLKQFALEQKCYFIDAGGVLSDGNGCLRPEMTGDGIHLSSRYMGVWKQYLMEHAVVVDSNPAVAETSMPEEQGETINLEAGDQPVENVQEALPEENAADAGNV